MPVSGKLIADFNPARAAGGKLTSFLRERVFSKNSCIRSTEQTVDICQGTRHE